jgi:hypothetical protein
VKDIQIHAAHFDQGNSGNDFVTLRAAIAATSRILQNPISVWIQDDQIRAKVGHIPQPTRRHWRERLLTDDSCRAGERDGQAGRLWTDVEETQLAETLRHNSLVPKRYCPPKLVGRLGQRIRCQHDQVEWIEESDSWDSSDSSGEAMRQRHPAQFTHKWRERFLRRSGLSLRRSRIRRRPKPDDEFLAEFPTRVELAAEQYPPYRVINVDETSWKLINKCRVTIAESGSDGVACEFHGEVKGCLTVIAAIPVSGTKLPLWVICRGKAVPCEGDRLEHFVQERRSARLGLSHQEKEWTNAMVAREYLDWLAHRVKGQPLFLFWDCFEAAAMRREGSKRRRRTSPSNSFLQA